MNGFCRSACRALGTASVLAIAGTAIGQATAIHNATSQKADVNATRAMNLPTFAVPEVAPEVQFEDGQGISGGSSVRGGLCFGEAFDGDAFFADLDTFPTATGTGGPQRIADNFEVFAAGAITDLTWWGTYTDDVLNGTETFSVNIYNDAGGFPDDSNPVATGLTFAVGDPGFTIVDSGLTIGADSSPVFRAEATGLSIGNLLTGTCYWFEVADAEGDPARGFAWASSAAELDDDLRAFARFDATDLWANTDLQLTDDFSFCVNGGTNFDAGLPDDCPGLMGDPPVCTDDLTAAPPVDNCLSIDTFSGGQGFTSNDMCGVGNLRVADNFIPAANGSISEICWGGFYGGGADVDTNPDDFRVRIYANAEDVMGNPLGRPEGLPADALETYLDTSFTVSSRLNVDTGLFEYSMDVSSNPFVVTAGTCYWLEITNNKAGNAWVWAGSVDGDFRVGIDGIFVGTPSCNGYSADEILDQSAPPISALVTDYSFCLGLDVTPTRASTDGVCDDAPAPANDECVDAIALAIDGVPVDGRTAFGSYDATVPPCGLVNSGQNDVWYTMAVGVDSNITISTNFAATDYDTTIRVFCAGTCSGASPTDLVCYASNDDVAGATNGQSEITADFAAGSYIINVSGFGGVGAFPGEGVFQIAATDNGAALDTPDTCGTPCEVTFDGRATEIDAGCAVDATFSFDCGLDEGGAGGEESNPAGNLIVGTDAGFQGWLRADGGTRDGDTWRFEVTGAVAQVVEFDFFFEQAIIIDIFSCPEPAVSALGGAFIFPADCEGGDLEIILDPGVYTMLMVPSYFSGSICEDDNTEYQVGFGFLPTGACCFPDGTCGDGFSNDICVNANGGSYQGDLSECAVVEPCPQPGACCDMDNNCTFVLESECLAAGGSYQGDGVECFTPAASGTVTASTDTPIAIPEDGGTVGATSTINRADGIVVGDLVVNVNITHPDLGDVIILLGSPDGLLVEVYGFTFITCAGTADMDTTFTSNAGLAAADACATIPLGAVVDSAVPFTAFEGQTSDGDWDLIVLDADDAGTGDTGTLNSWSLEILEGTNPACPTGPACDIDGTPGVAIGDLLAFLALWFAEDPGSDFNGDGTFSNGAGTGDIADLLAFLACWFPFQ